MRTRQKKIGIIYGLIFCGHLRFITVNSELFYYKILSKHFLKKKKSKRMEKKKHTTQHTVPPNPSVHGAEKRGVWGEKS